MVHLNRILAVVKSQGGFMDATQLRMIAEQDRLRNVLVQCGNGRFICAAQDAQHFMDIIQRDGQDYVRQFCLPTSDPIWR